MAALASLLSCVTRVPPASADLNLTPAVMFQRAQDASGSGDYTRALDYYQLFKEKYPEDRARGAWADYEIAFIYYKMGDYARSLSLFNELLDRYTREESLPDGPRILAAKIKEKIEAKLNPNTQEPRD
jgi:outer membrane protein assembly factor BamD (BamD/ComL family)